jgi:hypothetical protein
MPEETSFFPAVVAPTFNNARTLREIVMCVTKLGLPVFVVNDGSTDGTAAVLETLRSEAGVHVVTHGRNLGKAAALNSGFAAAAAAGCTHAVSIDTDGQLDPDEIPRLLEAARRSPRALVLGTRDDQAADYPQRSRLGRRASNLLVRMECGLRVGDSQCGFRVYPLELVRFVRCSAGRYGFETEILTRAGWAGAGVEEVPVSCTYQSPAQRVSHFRPWRDSLRAVGMHVRLLARAVAPWPHARWGDHATRGPRQTAWRRMVEWVNPARAWRDLREQCVGKLRRGCELVCRRAQGADAGIRLGDAIE